MGRTGYSWCPCGEPIQAPLTGYSEKCFYHPDSGCYLWAYVEGIVCPKCNLPQVYLHQPDKATLYKITQEQLAEWLTCEILDTPTIKRLITWGRRWVQQCGELGELLHGDKIDAIENAITFKAKREAADAFLAYLEEMDYRDKHHDQLIDYRKPPYKKGQLGFLQEPLDFCPVCGQLGAVYEPCPESGFEGETQHVIVPFFLGTSTVMMCNWNTGKTHLLTQALEDFNERTGSMHTPQSLE